MGSAIGGPLKHGAAGDNTFEKFLTPEAMLTPGAAGGVTMLISNALANNFGLPASTIGLGLSFLFGFLVLANDRKWWIQGIYYVLNSLIIFCVAFGSTNLAAGNSAKLPAGSSLLSRAYAQDSVTAAADVVGQLRNDYAKLDGRYKKEVDTLAKLQKNGAPQADLDKQNAAINDLQQQMARNLDAQNAHLSNIIAKSGLNREGESSGFFRKWTNPFRLP